ncbi:MAG: peptidylprolyl isomerase [Pseudomonadota bacterium]|uniref:peptidylprolyl isomerase n=1 Tax=Phenylobacterium sp. TaxID=1871053 RepID=UPI0025E0C123|nr:peptidylprolyl isomerase [Phenylobacterium sp.]MBT9469950.1 peptidylprolyl isomerase [Phenylobacterium sp.]
MIRPLLAAALLALAPAAHAADWRALDPAQTLVIDTSKGQIIVEMRPDFAPLAVERIKLLAREGVYDGLLFHRVVDHFVDQTGNPNNKDGGVSRHPDLAPEFTFRLQEGDKAAVVSRSSDAVSGFIGATPFTAASDVELKRNPAAGRLAWGAYCPGVAGMGRQAGETTANSEIFFMREASRRLDRDYTVWGAVVQGLDVVRAMTVGEPPANPDRMIKIRLAADLPAAERPRIEVLDEHGPAFKALAQQVRAAKGADFSVCDIQLPTRPIP